MKQQNPAFRVFNSFKDYGFVETILKIFHWLHFISVLHTFEFVLKELELPVHQAAFSLIGTRRITFREIEESELDALKFADGMYSTETFRMHFSKGMRFFAAFDGDLIVSVNGVNTRYADLIYIRLPRVYLPEGFVYFNCALTVPSFRDLSIGSALRGFVQVQIQKEGYQYIFGAVFIENRQAMRWNMRNGFQDWGRISYIQFLGRNFWYRRLTKVGRRYHFLLDRVENREPMTTVLEKSL